MECDLEKQDTIAPALDNASLVVCSIGASEKEVFDITVPYWIDYQATKNLIDAGKQDSMSVSLDLVCGYHLAPESFQQLYVFSASFFQERERETNSCNN